MQLLVHVVPVYDEEETHVDREVMRKCLEAGLKETCKLLRNGAAQDCSFDIDLAFGSTWKERK